MRIRVGFIGNGRGWEVWRRLCTLPSVEVVGGWISPPPPPAPAASLPRLDGLEGMLRQVDAVVMAVPIEERFALLRQVLRQQLPCWVEAPIGRTWDEVRQLVEESGVCLLPLHELLFHPITRGLRERWRAPQMLELRCELPVRSRQPLPVLAEEWLYPNLALLVGLVSVSVHGVEIVQVSVSGLHPEPDALEVRLRFENGLPARLWVSRLGFAFVHELRCYLPALLGRADFAAGLLEWRRLHPRSDLEALNVLEEQPRLSEVDPLQASLEAFLEAVHRNQDPPVSVYDAALVYQVFHQVMEKTRAHGIFGF